MKTWDLLDRETGTVFQLGPLRGESPDAWGYVEPLGEVAPAAALTYYEVAYCRETGEVVYR